MPALTLAPADLEPFAVIDSAKATQMIVDALALAELAAPCLGSADLSEKKVAQAKAVIRGAILRWHESGSGAAQATVAGPFQQTVTPVARKSLFWPSEIDSLQKICQDTDADTGAWGYDMLGCEYPQHAEICALHFGATYCSCGAVLAGAPLYEGP